MPPFGPIKRREFIKRMKRLDFEGPFSGGKHQFMVKGDIALRIPNPHEGDIGKELLSRILRQAQITREQWEVLE